MRAHGSKKQFTVLLTILKDLFLPGAKIGDEGLYKVIF